MDVATLRDLSHRGALSYSDGYRTKQSELGVAGFPILRVSQVGDGHLAPTDELDHIRSELRPKMGSKIALNGDIVLTTKGTVGRVARVSPPFEGFVYSPQVCFFRVLAPHLIDADYLYYWFGGPQFRQQISAMKTQTDMADYVNLRDLGAIAITLPPIDTQRQIGTTLRLLDDKIEVNRRLNETLEALARAIFQSWFVDFDPVRAKAEGRPPVGMDAETAALFPNSFEDSPLGPIPSGWQAVRLGTQIDAVRGLSYSGAGLTDAGEGLPLHNLNSIYEGGGYKFDGMKWYQGDYQPRHVCRPGDLLVVNTEQGHDRLLIGFAAIVPGRYSDSGLFSADLFRIRPRHGSPLTAHYLYLLLATSRYHDEVAGYSNGTTINHLPPAALQRPWLVLPPSEVVARFEAIIGPTFERQEQLVEENATLAELRDTLLTKLISGELRVRDA